MKEFETIAQVDGSHGHIGGRLYDRLSDAGVSVVRGDRDGNVAEGVTHIYSLAAYGNRYEHSDNDEIYRANVDRVWNLINNAEDAQAIILTSSSSVLLPTLTPYAESKRDMEEMAMAVANDTDMPIVIVRPSTVTGVGEYKERLIPKLISSCLTGEPMPFVGEPTHDFIDVDDFIDAMLMLSLKAQEWRGHVFNVSSGRTVSNEEVKRTVEKITGKKANVKRVDSMRTYDTKHWEVDNAKTLGIGWRPKKRLEQSIKEMVDDFKHKRLVP